jgi:hypothetical protein
MLEKVMQVVGVVGERYVIEKGTYIRVFRDIKAPYLLPKCIPDKLAL